MDKPGASQRRPGAVAAARAAKWQEPTRRQRFRLPNVPITDAYTVLSLLLLVLLASVLLYDFIQIAVVQHPDVTTQVFSVSILVSINCIHLCIRQAAQKLRQNKLVV